MAKRFIDTEIFDDSWFMDLSKDGKLLWIYFITKCNHAGMLELNFRLISFQTGIEDIDTVIKELTKSYVRVNEKLIFIPKFIKFQYPNFPQSNVRQQNSAIQILKKYNLFDERLNTLLSVNKELINPYDIVNGNVNGNDTKSGIIVFYDLEKVYEELIKSQTWIESICRYVKNQTPETLNLKIREFVDMLKAKENTGKTLRQYKEYFTNWIKYDNEKSTGRKFEGDFRVSVGVQNFTETE